MTRTALPTSFGSSSTDPALWLSNWKGQHFDGMNFSPTVLSTAQPEQQFTQPGGGMSVILPDNSVTSNDMSNELTSNVVDEFALGGAMAAQTLLGETKLRGAQKRYEYAKELANKKSGGGGGGFGATLGRFAGAALGSFAGPVGAKVGAEAGGWLGGQIG